MLFLLYSLCLRACPQFSFCKFLLSLSSSLEAVARICVTGFLFDPEISVFSLFSSPYSLQSEPYTPNPGPSSGVGRQTSLTRGRSITQRISRLRRNLMRPFVLAPHAPTSAYPMQEFRPSPATTPQLQRNDTLARVRNAAHRVHATIREPAEPTYLSRVMKSETVGRVPDAISLPFRLSIGNLHDKTQRNVPYLRQSWSRIDFVAILSFWIMFGLAIAGIEKGTYHVGIFRAMSVIRTARLLTITSGTTVRSLSLICLKLYLLHHADDSSFTENCSSSPYKCGLLCNICYGAFLVRALPSPPILYLTNSPELSAFNRSTARFVAAACSVPPLARVNFSCKTNFVEVTSILLLSNVLVT